MTMRVLLTGMNGTVAPAIACALHGKGSETIAWNRAEVPIDSDDAMRSFLERSMPDRVVHAALGDPAWAASLARLCREASVPFIFVSTVSVFAAPPNGPYSLDAEPNAEDDYGRYKKLCERLVGEANNETAIIRIGWQIGTARGSNNMIDWLERGMEEKGRIEVNANWIPSCSFLEDTAAAFASFLEQPGAGIHHVEGNSTGITFPTVVHGLNHLHGNRWTIAEINGDPLDNRLAQSMPGIKPVAAHFG